MYKYKTSVVVTKQIKPKIAEVNVSDIAMIDLYNDTIKTYVLADDILRSKEVILDLNSIKDKYINCKQKVKDVLINENFISTVDRMPTEVYMAKYRDAYATGYKVKVGNKDYAYPDTYPEELLPDLILTRPSYATNMAMIHTHGLVSLNGFLRPTDASRYKNEAYVLNGGKALRYSNINMLGILGFHDIAPIHKYLISKDDITKNHASLDFNNTIFIKTKEDISNKSVILSLAGYMVYEYPGVFFKYSSNLLCLKLNKLHLLEKILECRKYVDLSSICLDVSDNNIDMISTDNVLNDCTISNILTLDESFLAIIDTPELIYTKFQLQPSSIPGKYSYHCDPGIPMFMGYGKMVNYWVGHEDDGKWGINCEPTGYTNYYFQKTTNYYKQNIDDARVTTDTYDMEQPYFLQILSLR